ncbi:hypothetical protein [Novosphingobium sp. Chol11]|uniref:hypothetical protein n=1 Tax=Novosphingobium sp. Chol11 TaxID=1385763 RepID=UPI001144742F|nr:hypothetical protein [Novosphingobium sp. Chol11]
MSDFNPETVAAAMRKAWVEAEAKYGVAPKGFYAAPSLVKKLEGHLIGGPIREEETWSWGWMLVLADGSFKP